MKDKTNLFFIIVLVALLWFSPIVNKQPASALADAPAGTPRYITVTGDAEVRVVPDEVILNLGVETQNKNLHLAKDRNDKIVERVLDIVESYGIEARHIQIDYIYIDNNCYYSCNSTDEYYVRKTIAVTLKDIA